jgi:hypothetical protein
MPKLQPGDESPGDALALDLRDEPGEPEGGAAVREPRRPKPNAPLAGAVALELPADELEQPSVPAQELGDPPPTV